MFYLVIVDTRQTKKIDCMRNVLLILLLISLPGCQPGKESPARSTALREVKRLIDQDSFPAKYIIMYEEPSNDIGSIYMITPANSPLVEGSLERPEKVIKYKDRYICLMNPMESTDMPKNKLIEITDYPNDTTTGPVYDEIWYIGVSKNGKKHTLVSTIYKSYLTYYYYSFPQLLEYAFKDYDSTHLPRFILSSYSLVVDSSYIPKGILYNHIQRIDGKIYYSYWSFPPLGNDCFLKRELQFPRREQESPSRRRETPTFLLPSYPVKTESPPACQSLPAYIHRKSASHPARKSLHAYPFPAEIPA